MQSGKIVQKVSGLEAQSRAQLVVQERQEEKLIAILEHIRNIPDINQDIRDMKARMDTVEMKLDVVSSVVKEHSQILHDHTGHLKRTEYNPKR